MAAPVSIFEAAETNLDDVLGVESYEREPTPEAFDGEVLPNVTSNITKLNEDWHFSEKTKDLDLKIIKGVSKNPEPLKPRAYQTQVFEMAKDTNVILNLNTGLGKTLCATQIISHYLEIEDDKLIFFLAPQVPLVNQQARFIQQQCRAAEVRRLHGQMDIGHESWDHTDWVSVLRAGGNVFVMTPGMLHHLLVHAHILLIDIKLLIFDECHHASMLDEYRLIMDQHYARLPVPDRPRIFCMSAPMVKGNVTKQDIKEKMKLLTQTFDSVICTPDDNLVEPFDHEPEHQYISYEESDFELFENKYAELWPDYGLNEVEWTRIQSDWISVLNELGERMAVEVMDKYTQRKTRDSNLSRSRTSGTVVTTALQKKMEIHQSFVESKRELTNNWAEFREQAENLRWDSYNHTNKVDTLINHLRVFNSKRAGIQDKCIILCQRRIVAQYLAQALQSEFHTAGGAEVRVQYIISSSRPGHGLSSNMCQDDQKRILRGFRSTDETDPNRCDVIVATSILEEGIDIPTCKLVIRFNPSDTPKVDIQSAGRARAVGSKYVHLVVDSKEEPALHRINKFQVRRQEIHSYAKIRSLDATRWAPRKMLNLADYPGALYDETTGAFLSEEMAYRKIHETYTRFDKEVDFQIQWRNFAETPFDRKNFYFTRAAAVTGAWFLETTEQNTERIELTLNHTKQSNLEGTLKLVVGSNEETFAVRGRYNKLNSGNLTIVGLGRVTFEHDYSVATGRYGVKTYTSCSLTLDVDSIEEHEFDDESVYTLPDSLHFTHTNSHQPKVREYRKKARSYRYRKGGYKRRRNESSVELVHRSHVILPAIIPSSQRPPMEEVILEGPIRFGEKKARGGVSAMAMRYLRNLGILNNRFTVVGRNLRLNIVGMAAHDDDPVEFYNRVLPTSFNVAEREDPCTYYLHHLNIDILPGDSDPHFATLLVQPLKSTQINVFPNDEDLSGVVQNCSVECVKKIVLTTAEKDILIEFQKVFLMCLEVKEQWNKEKLTSAPEIHKDLIIVPIKPDTREEIDFERAERIGSYGTDYLDWPVASEFLDRPELIPHLIVRTNYAYYYYQLTGIADDKTIEDEMVEGVTFRDHYEIHHGLDIENDGEPLLTAFGKIVKCTNAVAVPQEKRIIKKQVYLVPEFCAVLPISIEEHKYAKYYPSLLWRLECMQTIDMAKAHLAEYTGTSITYPLMFQCLTTPAVDHEKDMNYNRIEFMGDSILLWIVAKLAYNLHPKASPIELTRHVNKRISNEFLAETIKKVELGLQRYVIAERFARKRFSAPGVPVANHLRETELSRNTIADVMEALIYASFINHLVEGHFEITDESILEDCRRFKNWQDNSPSEAFVSPFDWETLDTCLTNAQAFVTAMMQLPSLTNTVTHIIPEVPASATNRAATYAPPEATATVLSLCETSLRAIDPHLERHPRNLHHDFDPKKTLEENIEEQYGNLSEPTSPTKKKEFWPSSGKVRSQRNNPKPEPTILASGVEVVPGTTLPVPSKENLVKNVIFRSLKTRRIPLDTALKQELEENLQEMFDNDNEEILQTYNRIWSDAGYNKDDGQFDTDEILYRKIRRAYLRTKSFHQPSFSSQVTQNEVNLIALEEMLGYQFNDRRLLLQACIHSSINCNLTKHDTYQRMEFIGDAALGFMCSLHLVQQYPQWEEGEMSHAKSAIVSNSYFARKLYRRFLACDLKVEDFIITKSEEVREGIREFMNIFEAAEDDLVKSLQINMTPRLEREGDDFKFPKTMGDFYESIAGAILIDSDWNLSTMWSIFHEDLLLSDHQIAILNENILALKEIDTNKAKTALQEQLLDDATSSY